MRTLPVLLACATSTAALLIPAAADACGGLFCSTQPVEQDAERILFEVDVAGSEVTATIEIKYGGDADDFAWVVPVSSLPETPVLDVAPGSLMTLLETATNPSLIFPPTKCTSAPSPPADMSRRGDLAEAMPTANGDDDVDVTDLEQVGPYAPQRISSNDAAALVTWLNDNGYLITEAMEPAVEEYVALGYDFLGMKLAPDAGVTDIQPIVIRYPGTEPMVPVVLTSVAAKPEMAIMVFIAGDARWESSNYTNIEAGDDERLQADPRTGRDNYFPLMRWITDQADGHAFVTEFAGPSDDLSVNNIFLGTTDAEEAVEWAEGVLARNSIFTRMVARLSGHEMTADPVFQPSAGSAVSRVLDLSDRDEVEVCRTGSTTPISETPCGNTYCGVGGQCATTEDGRVGCVCPEGHTARAISMPDSVNQPTLTPTMTCLSDRDFLADVIGTVGGPADPCFADICGADGTCLAVNGFATCECDEGFAAVPNGVGGQTCTAVLETYEPTQILWAVEACESSCAVVDRGSAGGWGLLSLLVLGLRRRR
jgi:MYXO-CTERM domain-containing protein